MLFLKSYVVKLRLTQDPFYQLCTRAYRNTPPADDSYKACCKIAQSQVGDFMKQESVRSSLQFYLWKTFVLGFPPKDLSDWGLI